MPTIFSHAVVATGLASLYSRKPMPARFWFLSALCSILPDFDVAAFWFGVPYESELGHRGITHSILFAIVIGVSVALLGFGKTADRKSLAWLSSFFVAVTLSHALLDAFTDGGRGVALFAPFDSTRYFAPWRPIPVSPIGAGFLSVRGLVVLVSEMMLLWLPSAVLMLIGQLRRLRAVVNAP